MTKYRHKKWGFEVTLVNDKYQVTNGVNYGSIPKYFIENNDVFELITDLKAMSLPYWSKGHREGYKRLWEFEKNYCFKAITVLRLEDGFAIQGYKIYGVSLTSPECYIKPLTLEKLHINGGINSRRKWFVNKKNAESYLLMNLKCLSMNDIKEAIDLLRKKGSPSVIDLKAYLYKQIIGNLES